MAVHAHPDDEASSTGGILARYSDEGVRTVLVTCTRGELGDGPGGAKPGEDGHDADAVAATRREELAASCAVLGVSSLEMLGYHDSGMAGWPQNDAPGSFWTTPVDEAAGRLASLVERYRPQVVVTYDDNGFYGHPDHIQAHRITVAALAATDVAAKLYCTALPRSSIARFASLFAEDGVEVPDAEEFESIATADELVTARVDCSTVVGRKRAALAAHASQMDNAFFLAIGEDRFAEVFAVESFVQLSGPRGGAPPEQDLFAGVR
ncbi:MAG: PIG-L family deacetylase [Actinomycetota bacterium]|nr:PIG-L family deacetylase [Actinomycetota bacterium]